MVFGGAVPLLAQEDSEGGIRAEFESKRAEILRKIEENREKLNENRQKIEDSLTKDEKGADGELNRMAKDDEQESDEDKNNNSKERWNNIKIRTDVSVRIFEATIDRLNTLIGRVESRIDKIHDNGASTTEAVSFVNAAKDNLENAEGHILNIKNIDLTYSSSTASSTASTTATTTIKLNWNELKGEARMAREELVEAKQNLMKSLNVLKRLANDIRNNATTTLDIDDDNNDD